MHAETEFRKEAVETACAALAVNVLKGNADQVEALMVAPSLICNPFLHSADKPGPRLRC